MARTVVLSGTQVMAGGIQWITVVFIVATDFYRVFAELAVKAVSKFCISVGSARILYNRTCAHPSTHTMLGALATVLAGIGRAFVDVDLTVAFPWSHANIRREMEVAACLECWNDDRALYSHIVVA
jgi:hypothetical protein